MRAIPFLFVFLLGCMISSAIDLGRVNVKLTRSIADKIKTIPYEFVVLDDTTVRRSWSVGNRQICVDFSPTSDKLILAEIKYANPVSIAVATKDANRIGLTSSSEWKKTKASSVANIGLGKALVMKLGNGSYLFIESTGAKVSSLLLFASKPTTNRRDIAVFDGVVSSALGVAASGDANTNLQRDETRRWKVAHGSNPATVASQNRQTTPRPSPSATQNSSVNSGAVASQNKNSQTIRPSSSKSTGASTKPKSKVSSFIDSMTDEHWLFAAIILGLFFVFLFFRSGSK